MHSNNPNLYSCVTQAVLLGGYINGITAWGRGAVLDCEEVYWTSEINYCGFVQWRNESEGGGDDDGYTPDFQPKDWRDCPS
jgi:hypothetical protein